MFRIIRNSTTADAADMNDNFYHIGQGSIMPMAGNYLYSTDSSCDLGSATYKWNNGFIDNIDCATMNYTTMTATKSWGLLYNLDSSVNTLTSRMEFDVSTKEYSEFEIYCSFVLVPTTYSTMYLNGDSSASYYLSCIYFQSVSSVTSISTHASVTSGIKIREVNLVAARNTLEKYNIFAKVGQRRTVSFEKSNSNNSTEIRFSAGFYSWSNTSSTITTIVINNLQSTTNIRIYGR